MYPPIMISSVVILLCYILFCLAVLAMLLCLVFVKWLEVCLEIGKVASLLATPNKYRCYLVWLQLLSSIKRQ